MIQRELSDYLYYVAEKYPVVTLTGPRQSGKTTLTRELFPKKAYVSLEDVDERAFALEDPRGFLAKFKQGAIIDEAQYAPDLFSYIQTHVDQSKKLGEFILTGSQNFLLLEKISQSLAGRTAIAHLLPFSKDEIAHVEAVDDPLKLVFKGGYPRLYDLEIEPVEWYKTYVATYLERDIRQIKNVHDLGKFQLFLRLCAGRVGQLINFSSLASDCGIDQATAKSWLSILETSFIVYLLRPHYKNYSKRLVKQPKLYFYDTGLASYLLQLDDVFQLTTHYLRGALFENFVINELVKKRFNQGKEHNLYFWRDNHGHEVDVLFSRGENLTALEIKASSTIDGSFFKALNYWRNLSGNKQTCLVYAGTSSYERSDDIQVLGWQQLEKTLTLDV